MKLKLRKGQRNMLAFAVMVRRLWNCFRLPKQRLPWYDSAKRHWTIPPPGSLWGSIESLGMPQWRKWNANTLTRDGSDRGLLDLSLSWGSLRTT